LLSTINAYAIRNDHSHIIQIHIKQEDKQPRWPTHYATIPAVLRFSPSAGVSCLTLTFDRLTCKTYRCCIRLTYSSQLKFVLRSVSYCGAFAIRCVNFWTGRETQRHKQTEMQIDRLQCVMRPLTRGLQNKMRHR